VAEAADATAIGEVAAAETAAAATAIEARVIGATDAAHLVGKVSAASLPRTRLLCSEPRARVVYMPHGRCAVAPMAIVLGACGSTATIHHTDGRRTEAYIVAGDRHAVYVKTLAGTVAIPRKEVTAIDHPGETRAEVGLCWGLLGIVDFSIGGVWLLNSDGVNGDALAVTLSGGLILVTGIVMAIDGMSAYDSSVAALKRPPAPFMRTAERPLPVAPAPTPGANAAPAPSAHPPGPLPAAPADGAPTLGPSPSSVPGE